MAVPTSARAAGDWTLTYDLNPVGGMNCSMEAYWRDGSRFSIFSNANDFIGFHVTDPSWRLIKGQSSSVTFRFGGRSFTFPVNAVTTTAVIGNLGSDEYAAMQFLDRWVKANKMSIVFPNGETWPVTLTGTMATFREWVRCHDELERIARGNGQWGGGEWTGGGSGARPSANPF